MFITGGMRADYFTTAVRTGGAGMGGISLLLIEADRQGVTRTNARRSRAGGRPTPPRSISTMCACRPKI